MRATRSTRPSLGRALLAALVLLVTFGVAGAEAAERSLSLDQPGTVNPRIVNPDEAIPVSWQAALLPREGDSVAVPFDVFCGATIRDERHVITAAHCVDDSNAIDLAVAAGFFRRVAPDAMTAQVRRVTAITSHPAFGPSLGNDLAILTLETPLALGGAAQSRPVVTAGSDDVGREALISGWGDEFPEVEGAQQPDELQVAEITVYPDASCARYGDAFDSATMLCAGGTNALGRTKDTCQGDSGGPLMRWNGTYDALIGIVSFGYGCGDPLYPGIYTRLANPDLNARAIEEIPPPRLEPTWGPIVAGTLRAGETLSCDGAQWNEQPTELSYLWLTAAYDGATVTDVRVEGLGQTLALGDAAVGRIVTCEARAVNAGGARTQQARPLGYIAGRLPAPSPPAPPPPPPPPPVLPDSIQAPRPDVTRRRCARRRCALTITASEKGNAAVRATVSYRRLTGCRKGRGGRRCRAVKAIRAKRIGDGLFRLVTPRLAPARWSFVVTVLDAAGNRASAPAVVLRVKR